MFILPYIYNIFILQVTLYTSCTVLKKRRRHIQLIIQVYRTPGFTRSLVFFSHQGIVLYISLAKLSMSIASSKNDISTRLLSQCQRKYNITTQQRVFPMCTHTHVRQEQDANTFFYINVFFIQVWPKQQSLVFPNQKKHPIL